MSKHVPTKEELDEILRQIRETGTRSAQQCALLCVVITTTQHFIEYPAHWQINNFAGRLDRILNEPTARAQRKTIKDGEW